MTRHNKNYIFLDLCLPCYSLLYGLSFSEYGSDQKLIMGCARMCTMGALKEYTIMFVFILPHTTFWFVIIWTFYFANFQMCIYVGTCMLLIFYVTLYVHVCVVKIHVLKNGVHYPSNFPIQGCFLNIFENLVLLRSYFLSFSLSSLLNFSLSTLALSLTFTTTKVGCNLLA